MKHIYIAVFKEKHSFSLYKAREKSLKSPIVVYDIINTYLYSIVYTYIECVCLCVSFFLPNYCYFFCGSATFRKENSYALQVSVSPNLRKIFILEKVSIPFPQPKDSFHIFCFTTDQRITIKEILEFMTVSFYFASCFNKQIYFNI